MQREDSVAPPNELLNSNSNGGHDLSVGTDAVGPLIWLRGVQLGPHEWDAIFYEAFKVPQDWCQDIENEDAPDFALCEGVSHGMVRVSGVGSWWEGYLQLQQRLRAYIPEYPLLARICDTYSHAVYVNEEIADLRRECELALDVARPIAVAISGLQKLLYGCDRASALNGGLLLVSD